MESVRKRARTVSDSKREKRKAKKYYDEEGDLEIISSDGVSFKIQSYILQATSPIFRDMMRIRASTDTHVVELNDKDLESADIMTLVFDFLTTQVSILDGIIYAHAIRIIRFLIKYNMDRELDRIRLQLIKGLRDRDTQLIIWFFATTAKLYDLAGAAIVSGRHSKWKGDKETADTGSGKMSLAHEVPSANVFDITSWGMDWHRLVPRNTMCALGRSSRHIKSFDNGNKEEFQAMAVEFVRLMQLQ